MNFQNVSNRARCRWVYGVLMQFERVHLEVFSTFRFAPPTLCSDWILTARGYKSLLDTVKIFPHSHGRGPNWPLRCMIGICKRLHMYANFLLDNGSWKWTWLLVLEEEKSWQAKMSKEAVDDNLEQVKVFLCRCLHLLGLARVALHQHQDHELEWVWTLDGDVLQKVDLGGKNYSSH